VNHPFAAIETACRAQPPLAALVLGSGLNDVADSWPRLHTVPFAELPGMPKTTVAGHQGRLCLHEFAGRTVLVFQGRLHFYEGHPWDIVERPVHIARELGVRNLILTNASGGIGPAQEAGTLMAIRDHIWAMRPDWWRWYAQFNFGENFERPEPISKYQQFECVDLTDVTVPRAVIDMIPESIAVENRVFPLSLDRGVLRLCTSKVADYDFLQRLNFILNRDIQPVFADAKQIGAAIARHYDQPSHYSQRLLAGLRLAAADAGVELNEGVYACVTGPSYETPAEICAFRALGADAIGMSTVHEAITARQLGMDVAGISCIANRAAGISPTPLSHAEVLAVVTAAANKIGRLLQAFLDRLND